MPSIAPASSVNPPFLDFINQQPSVTQNGQRILLPNNDFGRWFVRSKYEKMTCSDAGKAWFQVNDPAVPKTLDGLLKEPRIYQRLALFRMKLGSCALWLDMGLGKTFISFMYALTVPQPYFLVVCPVSVFGVWSDQAAELLDPKLNVNFVIAHGPKRRQIVSELRAKKPSGKTFIITSYDSLETIRESLQYLDLGAIFFDEAQRIKYMTTGRTKTAHALVRAREDVPRFLLSGTPSTTKVVGYYSLYELIQQGATGCSSLFGFKQHFIETKKFMICRIPLSDGSERAVHIYADTADRWLQSNFPPGQTQSYAQLGYRFSENLRPNARHLKIMRFYNKETGIKNLPDLQRISTTWAYTLRKEDVMTELPEKTYETRTVDLTPVQKKAYSDLLLSSQAEIGSLKFSFRNTGSIHAKLHQIANGYLRTQDAIHYFPEQSKMKELLELIEEAGDQKIVVWSPWIPQLDMIDKTLDAEKIDHVLVYGKTSAEARAAAITKFTTDANCKVFISNPSVGGIGLNLTCAHLEVFMSNWYQPDVRDQAEDRCHRQGQTNGVTIIDLIAENTIEAKILRDLRAKISTENAILSPKELGA